MKKIKCILTLAILFSLYIFVNAYSYVNAVSSDLQKSVFRLHVIANSDSTEDQNLKYTVRNKLIEYMNALTVDASSKEEVIKIASENLDNFQKIAENTIKSEGFDYSVTVEIGNFEFPTKTYGDISFPAGCYDALRVKIGSASGQNWWCVMFPPLCFVDVSSGVVPDSSKDDLQNALNDEDYAIISECDNSSDISFKFKLIEFFAEKGLITAKNN